MKLAAVADAGFPTPPVTRAIAEAALRFRIEELPGDVVELVRQCVLDYVAVTVAGVEEPPARIVREVAIGEGEQFSHRLEELGAIPPVSFGAQRKLRERSRFAQPSPANRGLRRHACHVLESTRSMA